MREIEWAGKINFTGIINNTNIGEETTPETVLNSVSETEKLSCATSLPIFCTTVSEKIFPALENKIPNLIPLKLQAKIL
jgi:hypothetical protein